MPGDATRSHTAGRARRCGPAAVAVLAVALTAATLACGGDEGRTLRAPDTDQTTTTTVATSIASSVPDAGTGAADGSGGAAGTTPPTGEPLRLSSSAIAESGTVPTRYTCRGADVSPPLLWTSVPAGTVELAVVVRDVDAEGFVHWVLAGLPPDLGGVAEGTVPAGAAQATNGFGRPGWAGPCPPSGTHNYEFRVYALSQASGVVQDEAGDAAAGRVEASPALASAVLSASASAG